MHESIDYRVLPPLARGEHSDAIVHLLLSLLEQSDQESGEELLFLGAHFLHNRLAPVLLVGGDLGGEFLDRDSAPDQAGPGW